MRYDLQIAWQNDNVRVVIWYKPFIVSGDVTRLVKPDEVPTVLKRQHSVEKILTKDALGQPNWVRATVTDDIFPIIEEFLNSLGFSKEKSPEKK